MIGKHARLSAQRRDGREFPISISFSVAEIRDNLYFTGIIRDITEYKEMEDRVLQTERLAAVGNTVTHIAHEIKNPLLIIGRFARQLLKIPDLDDKARHKLTIIAEEVSQLEEMVAEMREFVRRPPAAKRPGSLEAPSPPPWNCSRIPSRSTRSRCAGWRKRRCPPVDLRPQADAPGAYQPVQKRPGGHAQRAVRSPSPAGSRGTTSKSASPTPAKACPRRWRPIFFSPISPPRTRGPAWGWPSARASSRSTAASSRWTAPRAKGPPLPFNCPWSGGERAPDRAGAVIVKPGHQGPYTKLPQGQVSMWWHGARLAVRLIVQ